MTLQLSATPPFILSLNGYAAPAKPPTASATSSAQNAPKDILDVKVPLPGGTFSVEAGDTLAVRDLFDAGASTSSIARYRVALRDDPSTPGGGKLLLNGTDVTGQVDFSPDDFQRLQFKAGPNGASSDLVVVARTGKPDGQGGLTNILDSPAVQITAQTTGTRSINAATAFRSQSAENQGEADVTRIVQESNIFTGFGATRPALTTVVSASELQLSFSTLATLLGGFQQSGAAVGAQATALSTLSHSVIGSYQSSALIQSAATVRAATALAALLSNSVGGFETNSRSATTTLLALQAYQRSSK